MGEDRFIEVELKQEVLSEASGGCCNCGSTRGLLVEFIVPVGAGGQLVKSNCYVICRACAMAVEGYVESRKAAGNNEKAVCIRISRNLYNAIQQLRGFKSMNGLVRTLVKKFLESPDSYSDLDNYQDVGSDVKITLWLNKYIYSAFRKTIEQQGMTVTDALKGLIVMYITLSDHLVSN